VRGADFGPIISLEQAKKQAEKFSAIKHVCEQ